MILISKGRYTSTYDKATKEVTMCVLSEEFSMFADQPKSAFYAIVNLNSGVVQAEDDDKQAIVEYLLDNPNAERNENGMSDDSFLHHMARIDHCSKFYQPVERKDSRAMQEHFGNELKNVNTHEAWYEFLEEYHEQLIQRGLAKDD